MGVFDYLSSLFDSEESEETSDRPGAPQERTATLAPSLDPAQIEARRKQEKQGQRKKGVRPGAPPPKERRSKDALPAPPPEASQPHAPQPSAQTAVAAPAANAGNAARAERSDAHASGSAAGAASAVAIAPEPEVLPAQDLPFVTPDEADQAIDNAFGAGASQSVTHVSAIARELDEAAVRELYAGIAAQHARPVKNFVFELKRGTAAKEWVEICRPVMATLIQGAEAMGLPDAARPMKDFDEALALAGDGASEALDPTVRELLLSAWNEMSEALPDAFQLGDDERRRESVIIHALLKQIPDVGSVTFERLYSAGLTSLEALFLANKEDLTATTGIPFHLCERICDRIQEHRREYERMQRVMGMNERRERLRVLLDELRKRHDGFERAAAEEWRDPAQAEAKRAHRQGRQVSALKIEVVLAEMGEIELIEEIQKLPFQRRIERLHEFMQSRTEAAADASRTPEAVSASGPLKR